MSKSYPNLTHTLKELNISLITPAVVYNLDKPIRSKIFNIKSLVSDLNIEENKSCHEFLPCHYKNSPYLYKDHDQSLAGNLQIVGSRKLRKILSKCPKYQPTKPINCNSTKNSINKITEGFFSAWCLKNEYSSQLPQE